MEHFNNYMLFLAVSRDYLWGLVEKAVVESTHVLTECNERKAMVGKKSELVRGIGASSICDCRLQIVDCKV